MDGERACPRCYINHRNTSRSRWTPLHQAMMNRHSECIRILLQSPENFEETHQKLYGDVLSFAVCYESTLDVLKMLVEAGASVNGCPPFYAPLRNAISNADPTSINALLHLGADLMKPGHRDANSLPRCAICTP